VGQIASSLVFDVDGESVVVLTSGANRVSEAKLAAHFGADEGDVSMADPETVRETTGWAIGGVPPFCHARAVPVLFDESLAEYETVWAAAGTPRSVFPIAPEEVRRASDAEPADVTHPR
jgi:prolyl-tRNA editing enzyme YbaK/EbsC (Cys-tRNA(Pro) deacylase)